MQITVGTVTRTALLIIAIINMLLQSLGKNTLPFTDDDVSEAISAIFMAITAITAWWKNNSFSDFAIRADSMLSKYKNGEQGASQVLTYNEFVSKYAGKGTDYDSVYGVQCVDLAKLYIDKVFGIVPKSIGNAHAYYDDFNKHPFLYKNFKRIKNTPDFVPQKGDIVVWSKGLSTGKTGHIAIATGEGNTNEFYSYDQNWGSGAKRVMRRIEHSYYCVLGVLRPINQKPFQTAVKKVNKPKIINGKTYLTIRERGLYKGYGSKSGRVKYKDALSDTNIPYLVNHEGYAYYKMGTAFTVISNKTLDNKNIWCKTPSGYLCAYDYKPDKVSVKIK